MSKTSSRVVVLTSLLTVSLLASGCAYVRHTESAIEQGQAAIDAGDEAKAEQIYRDTMRDKRSKDSEEARALLINLLLARGARMLAAGQPEDAMGHYREALALDRGRDESRIAYARALMKVERYTEAIDVLMEGQGCSGCKSLISVMYIERADAEVRDGEFAEALADYDLALDMNRDPRTVLAKVDVYAVGHYGTGEDAAASLDRAARILPIEQVGIQQLWWDRRVAMVYTAALAGEHVAVDQALALADPRGSLSADQRTLDRLNLHMYVASLEIYAHEYERGTDRGLRTYAEADGAVPAADLSALRETLMGLFMQRVATHFAEGDDAAARAALAQALELDPNDRILNFQSILATAARNTGTARAMLGDWEADPDYARLRALVETVYAEKMLGIGQVTAASGAVDKAERYAPDLLETHLARAEIEVEVRFDGLKKVWAEQFREIGSFRYPSGRINNVGRALAELRWVEAHLDDAATRDYLRAPRFQARVEALAERIGGFYPYDAELAPASNADKAVLRFVRSESGPAEVRVQGPKREHVVAVPGEGQIELVLDAPGLTVVAGPGRQKALFAEPGVVVIIEI